MRRFLEGHRDLRYSPEARRGYEAGQALTLGDPNDHGGLIMEILAKKLKGGQGRHSAANLGSCGRRYGSWRRKQL